MQSFFIKTLTGGSASAPGHKQWKKIQRLWADIENRQARNQRYDDKISRFYETYTQLAQEAEQQKCLVSSQFIHHLIRFVTQETIRGDSREALYEWIQGELLMLEANPFHQVSTIPLLDQFLRSVADLSPGILEESLLTRYDLDEIREELSEIFGEMVPFSDEVLAYMYSDPEFMLDYQLKFQQLNYDAKDQDRYVSSSEADIYKCHLYMPFGRYPDEEDSRPSDDGERFFQHKFIRNMYCRLQKILQSGQEAAPQQQQHKEEGMQQLGLAKKEKDTFELLKLAQIWLPECELSLDNKALKAFETALKRKLELLNTQYQQLRRGHGLKAEIWLRFGRGSAVSGEQNIRRYVVRLEEETRLLQARLANLTSVAAMQEALCARIREADIRAAKEDALMDDGFAVLYDIPKQPELCISRLFGDKQYKRD